MTTSTKSETAAKKDVTKLQRAIVDGLEDVKAQDIQVFNTEHLSPLFERVIVASGTSNRQTKALAASVRDAVKEAGFAKPRIEGEDNGEWIIVDCGAAVAHIMQPTIRQYYRLEELWGDTPVRLKLGAAKPVAAAAKKAPAKKKAAAAAEVPARKPGKPKVAIAAGAEGKAKAPVSATRKVPARKTPAAAAGAAAKAPAAKKPAAAKKAPVKTVVVKPAVKKPAAKKSAPRVASKPAARSAAKPAAATKSAAKKAPARKG
ncbi:MULTISPECIES: ribosome silencing factor [Acidovorax]|uniref:Ribosomal silencing factor RsfS n=1 Tax=Acidovorax soli TaxID=592050 RepID=A0A1H3VSL4_9BURK|nr:MULTISPECIES: ribosome silencing factor [Acidovorax]SDZ77760.1 ribosome-associated protein [Acidovorax soli]